MKTYCRLHISGHFARLLVSASLACLLLSPSFGATDAYRTDVTIPLEAGSIVVRDIRLSETEARGIDNWDLAMSFALENHTSTSWDSLDLEFKIGTICAGETRQWTYVFHSGPLPVKATHANADREVIVTLPKKPNCEMAIAKGRMLRAANATQRIEGSSSEIGDLTQEIQSIQGKREAARAAAAIAARRKQAEDDAHYAKAKAAADAKFTEERAATRAACSLIYDKTVDRKVSDLTVRETQQVQACQMLGFYRSKY